MAGTSGWGKRPLTFDTFELPGRVVEEWTPPGRWLIDDVSPDQHTVAMTDATNDPNTRTFVLDYRRKAIIQKWPEGGPFSKEYFAEAGKSVCAVGGHGRGSRACAMLGCRERKKVCRIQWIHRGATGSGEQPRLTRRTDSYSFLSRRHRGIRHEVVQEPHNLGFSYGQGGSSMGASIADPGRFQARRVGGIRNLADGSVSRRRWEWCLAHLRGSLIDANTTSTA